jgi:hypothetical protein
MSEADETDDISKSRATDEEQQFAEKAVLVAALDALKDLDPDEDSETSMVRKILRAFRAAYEMEKKIGQQFKEARGGKRVFVYIDTRHIVGSALQALHWVKLFAEVEPYSVGGAKYAAFAAACHILSERANYECAFDLGFMADHVADDALADLDRLGEQDN